MNRLSIFLKKPFIQQLLRYLITGFTAFGIEYAMYVFLLKVVKLHYILASVIVYALVFWFSLIVNRIWSFKSKGRLSKQLMQYGLLFAFNLVVSNILIMKLLTDVVGLDPMLSPFIKMAFVVSWNFLIYKYIIYKE